MTYIVRAQSPLIPNSPASVQGAIDLRQKEFR
jgi:hypothetical protein